jgi:hypothetical protein
MKGNEYLLSLNGEPIATSKGVTFEDITQTPAWNKWELVEIDGNEYTFRHRHRGTVTTTLHAEDWSLKKGDVVTLEFPLEG